MEKVSPHQRARYWYTPFVISMHCDLVSVQYLPYTQLSTEHRRRGAERLCWMCDCTCLESNGTKSSGKLGHQLHCQTLAGQNTVLFSFRWRFSLQIQAETGVQLYRVCRGKDNFSLGSTLNGIVFSPDGNFLTSRGREVISNVCIQAKKGNIDIGGIFWFSGVHMEGWFWRDCGTVRGENTFCKKKKKNFFFR